MDTGYVEISDGLFSWGNSRADKSGKDASADPASKGKGGKPNGKDAKGKKNGKNGKGTGKGAATEEVTIKEQKDEKPALEVRYRHMSRSIQSTAEHSSCLLYTSDAADE